MPSLTILVFKEKKNVRVEKNIKKEKMEVGEIDLEGNATVWFANSQEQLFPYQLSPVPVGYTSYFLKGQ